MRRYAIVILVFFLLIINTLMQRANGANPLLEPHLWALRLALPGGIAAAALCIAALGMGAQMWRGILPASGAEEWSPRPAWSYMCVCGLWCGWIPLLCALAFYPLQGDHSMLWLIGSFITLVLCRMLSLVSRHPLIGLFAGLLTAAIAVLCGQILWPATPLDLLVISLSTAPAFYLLWEKQPARQLLWLTVAALIFCAYAAAFGYMLAFYAPAAGDAVASPWGMWVAGGYIALALALIVFPGLRHSLWGRRAVALLALLGTAAWLWLHFSTALMPQEELPALGFYALGLVLFGVPMSMILRGLR